MCVANSARSQMAEGLARKILGPEYSVQSAGAFASSVNGYAIRVMHELGIDISVHTSKSVTEIDLAKVDTVVVLCGEDVCPPLPGHTVKLHWPIKDPAAKGYTEEKQMEGFREARDKIKELIEGFARGRQIRK